MAAASAAGAMVGGAARRAFSGAFTAGAPGTSNGAGAGGAVCGVGASTIAAFGEDRVIEGASRERAGSPGAAEAAGDGKCVVLGATGLAERGAGRTFSEGSVTCAIVEWCASGNDGVSASSGLDGASTVARGCHP